MKKSCTSFLNLLLSIISFSFILNISFVSAKDEWINVDGITTKLTPELKAKYPKVKSYSSIEAAQKENIRDLKTKLETANSANTPPISSLPVPGGYAGKFVKSMGGNPYPADSVLYEGKWIDPKDLPAGAVATETASGAGYSTAGILQGAAWAVAVVGAVQFIAPFAGANSQQTNSISAAMGVGVMTGTN